MDRETAKVLIKSKLSDYLDIITTKGKNNKYICPLCGSGSGNNNNYTPALSILTINALTASNLVIIPAQADIYSLQGIGQLFKTIQTVKKYCNRVLSIKGLVVTRYNARTVLSRDMTELLEDTAKQLQTKLYNTKIRECTAIKEAQASKKDVFTYAPKSNATADYTSLIEEIIEE